MSHALTEREGFMSYTSTSHQAAIQLFYLHFWEAVMFTYSQKSVKTAYHHVVQC